MPGFGYGPFGYGPFGYSSPPSRTGSGSIAAWSSTETTWGSLIATWHDVGPPRSPKPTSLSVGVWEHLGGSTWGKVGEVLTWTTLAVEPRYNDPGIWSMTVPRNEQALKVTKARLVTFDLSRDDGDQQLMTGVVKTLAPGKGETGSAFIEFAGVDVLGVLSGSLVWPTPGGSIDGTAPDTNKQSDAYWERLGGPAETVLREVVVENWVKRLGKALTIPPNQGRGTWVNLHERFSNLLTLVTTKCEAGGLGVRMGLVPTSSARAELTLEFFVPQDRSQRVRLSHRVGSLRTWKQTDNAPTVTRAIVAGGGKGKDRIFKRVTDPAVEAEWGGWPVEVFVDQRGTSDIGVLTAAGQDALNEGAAQSGFELEATESVGIRLGTHFNLGDIVAVEIMDDLSRNDRLRAVQVEGGSGGITIKLVPGLPDAGDPLFQQAQIIRATRREVKALQREEG